MRSISEADIQVRLQRDNPWWEVGVNAIPEERLPRRVYFRPFADLALDERIRRAAVLLGPRRVGKTVMIKQLVAEAITTGYQAANILYVSIDAPVYAGFPLERYLSAFKEYKRDERYLVLFDEIQYLKDWEVHLKDLIDSYPNVKFVATGSAAAALRLKSKESGAGRFSEFMLPPLTFFEFLDFQHLREELIKETSHDRGGYEYIDYEVKDIGRLNFEFVNYLNYGGYPEAVLNEHIRKNTDQFIRNDIIDKVLLKDLPSLYGINDIQELNRLFSFLAYNAGQEASLEKISRESGLTKPTIKRYIEYLESAFLIIKISTVDDTCKSLQRERNFKIYLNNPSMRAALFAPVSQDDTTSIGHLTESAIFSQWQHDSRGMGQLRYARWRNEGEVDIVYIDTFDQKPRWVVEIKWSDEIAKKWSDATSSMAFFIRKNPKIGSAVFTTRTFEKKATLEERPLEIRPSALYCYLLGRNITRHRIAELASTAPVTESPSVA
ncbi:ATP-binding protein [Chelatococcus sambhunathii]|uniref:ATP-binding protein n=1 Tax=Chelatococcus sambhunathii TaxID=363953 RepID=A0ABU1DC19_9HYPH|nr:ATP-binding protein [Chelatococcus sambhunathii]MDR4305670.1 ATP-binding protein [Chelatococcus sambhunathii]